MGLNADPDLIPEIDWLLTSGQVSSSLLAESLVRTFYAPVFCWAYFLYGAPALAEEAALQTFAGALAGLSTYHSGLSPYVWLLELTCQANQREAAKPSPVSPASSPASRPGEIALLRAFGWLDWEAHALLFLHFGLHLSLAESEHLLKMNGGDGGRRLALIRQKFIGLLPEQAQLDVRLETWLPVVLAQAYPSPELTEEALVALAKRVEGLAHRQTKRRSRAYAYREFLWIGIAILTVLAFTLWLNRASPEEAPSLARLAAGSPSHSQAENSPHTNVVYFVRRGNTLQTIAGQVGMPVDELMALNAITTSEALYPGQPLFVTAPAPANNQLNLTQAISAAPLTPQSSPAEFRQRIAESHTLWHTLWADIEYAPTGTVEGTARHALDRFQVWVSQPDLCLEITGPADELPYFRRLTSGGRRYFSAGSSIMYFDSFWPGGQPQLMNSPLLYSLVFPGLSGWGQAGEDFRPVKSASIAGRLAVVVDWMGPAGQVQARLWLDAQTGIILRQQKFNPGAPGQVSAEAILRSIVIDVPLPIDLFNPEIPWQGSFAPDYHGPAAAK